MEVLTRVGRGMVVMVMLVVGFAGVSKIWDLDQFDRGLSEYWGFPDWLAVIVVICVPLLEVGCSIGWLAGYRRTLIGRLVLGMLTCFTVAFGWLWMQGRPPDCVCFGQIRLFEAKQDAALWTVVRNALLIGALMVGGWLMKGGSRHEAAT